MQFNLRMVPVLTLALVTTFTACKKESKSSEEDNTTEVKAHTEDNNNVSNELSNVADDANVVIEGSASFSGRVQGGMNTTGIICGGTAVADTMSNPKKITITYNGNNCAGSHSRNGVVVISLPANTKWKAAGAAITVSIQNLKVTRLSDNKSITINGTQTITNVSGGLLINLPTQQSIIHTITSSNMSITFDDGTQRTWQVARKRTFTYSNGVVLTLSGIGTSGTVTNAAEWGTNRYGHAFTTSITQPLVFRQDCNGRLTAGEIKHQGFATATATFGLNANGVPTGCPGTAAYYYKLTWTGPGGNSFSTLIPY